MKRALSILFLLLAGHAHAVGEYYLHGSFPTPGSVASSSAMRAELDSIQAGFDKLPALSGNGSKICAVNSGGTALEAITTTGTGSGVRATSPTLVTPVLGVASATSLSTGTLKAADGTAAVTIANSTGVVTIPSAVLTTADINGGTLDGVTIGGSSAAPGSFTTITATGDVTFGDAATDVATVRGRLDIGPSSGDASIGLYLSRNTLTGANQKGIYAAPVMGISENTSTAAAFFSRPQTYASAYTATLVAGLYALDAVKGATSTITGLAGVYIADQTVGASNYGIYSAVSSGSGKYNIYATGTASNYFGGDVGVGTSSPSVKLDVNDDSVRIRTAKTPASASATCSQGQIAWDTSYLYACVATNTWKRAAIATW